MEVLSRKEQCVRVLKRTQALIQNETDCIANLANTAAVLWQFLEQISWAGFYIMRGEELVLGPFQGKPACKRIALGKGVCGTADTQNNTKNITNVHEFPGHIACDSASKSEIVVPICVNGKVAAVLDIDSAIFDRFGPLEAEYMEQLCLLLAQQCQWVQ